MGQTRIPTPGEYLRARANVARRLVRQRALIPEDALAFTVWPTADIREAELAAPRGTIANRATLARINR